MNINPPPAPRSRQSGFSLIELIVTLGIGMLVLTVMVAMSVYTTSSFSALATYSSMDQADRVALDLLTTEFRQATNVVAFSTNSVALAKVDGDVLRYVWDAQARTMSRRNERPYTATSQVTIGGKQVTVTNVAYTLLSSRTILENCDNLTFFLYKASPATNSTMDLDATTDLRVCKAIKVQWKCNRNPYPYNSVTETVTSGTIVMRMQDTDY